MNTVVCIYICGLSLIEFKESKQIIIFGFIHTAHTELFFGFSVLEKKKGPVLFLFNFISRINI